MKKLMMIAALAAVTAGFAECKTGNCAVIPDSVIQGGQTAAAWAYKWKFTGKTTKPVKIERAQKQSSCVLTPKCCAYTRTATSLKIEGYTFYCTPVCGDFEEVTQEVFWQKKPAKAVFEKTTGVNFELANQIGKKGKEFEAAGTANFATADGLYAYNLTFAGLGKYDKKNLRPKCCKGNFAGTRNAPAYVTPGTKTACTCEDPTKDVTKVWECCSDCPSGDSDSVAFGKWSVKYNKSWAKKYAAGDAKVLVTVWPKWAR